MSSWLVYLNDMTEMQQEKLDAFKQLVGRDIAKAPQYAEVVGDARLLRYLRAFAYNVEEASTRYTQFLQWRRENGVDAIRDELVRNNWAPCDFPDAHRIMRHWPMNLYWSKDNEGNPVVYDNIGQMAASALLADFNNDDDALLKHHILVMEHKQLLLDRLSREAGRLVFCYEIKDLSDIGWSLLAARPLLSKMSKITSDFYVETTRKVAIINLPWGFPTFYSMAEPFIPERTRTKINVIKHAAEIELRLCEDMPLASIKPDRPQFDIRPVIRDNEDTMSEVTAGWFTPEDLPEGPSLTPSMEELEAGVWQHRKNTLSPESLKSGMMACEDSHKQQRPQTKVVIASAAQDPNETRGHDTEFSTDKRKGKKPQKSKTGTCTCLVQ